MINNLFRIKAYLKHLILAQRNNKGFGIQSPFAYRLLKETIKSNHTFYIFQVLRKKKMELLRDKTEIETEDFGSKGYRKIKHTIGEVVFKSVKSTKQQEIIFRLVNLMQSQKIVELGTSVGLTTAYMAMVNQKAQVVTIEACHVTSGIATTLWKSLGITNITLIEDTFDAKLLTVLKRLKTVDFAFIDGNHKGDALLNYFDQIEPFCTAPAMVVVDDIYWSRDMYKSWLVLINHGKVTLSFDLFHFGVIVLNANVTPGHYRAII